MAVKQMFNLFQSRPQRLLCHCLFFLHLRFCVRMILANSPPELEEGSGKWGHKVQYHCEKTLDVVWMSTSGRTGRADCK